MGQIVWISLQHNFGVFPNWFNPFDLDCIILLWQLSAPSIFSISETQNFQLLRVETIKVHLSAAAATISKTQVKGPLPLLLSLLVLAAILEPAQEGFIRNRSKNSWFPPIHAGFPPAWIP